MGQREQEGEREAGDQQRQQDAPVVVRELDRAAQQPEVHQGPVEPALRTKIAQHALRHQHGAQCHGQHQQRGQQALSRHQPHAHSHRHGQQQAHQCDRKGQRQRLAQGVKQKGVAKKALVIAEPTAHFRLKRDDQAVQKGVDKQTQQQEQRGQHQQGAAINAAASQLLPPVGGWRCHAG